MTAVARLQPELTTPRPTILLVEDDDIDAMGIERALGKLDLDVLMHRAHDGVEALEMLRRGQVAAPFIVLLDLNMPRMNGFEFLAELRADSRLHKSVVFVTTTSNNEDDRANAYAHNVAGYVLKDRSGPGFTSLMKMLALYWQLVDLPT